jgi:tetratricopeptide (TPR) repeat protein
MRAVTLAVLVLVVMTACTRDRQPSEPVGPTLEWLTTLADATQAAQENGDLIVLSFEAPWCPWSRLMRESVYVHTAVVESLSAFKCVLIDVDADSTLAAERGIVMYPTMVITDAYGCELGRMAGYHTPDEFLSRLTRIRKREDMLSEMFRQEEASVNDPTFLIAFGRALVELGMYDGALIRFDRAAQIDDDDRFGTLQEATYSLGECYMLAGEYKEAGRRFRLFAQGNPTDQRAEHAMVLAALCYQRVNYKKVATQIYEDYLEMFGDGIFAVFVKSKLDSLNSDVKNAG